MDFQGRLNHFLAYKNISQRGFEAHCGMGIGTASKLSVNSYPRTFIKISNAFPDLNIDWLRTGEGEMLNPAAANHMGDHNENAMQNAYNSGNDGNNGITAGELKGILKAVSEAKKGVSCVDSDVKRLAQTVEILNNQLGVKDTQIAEKDIQIATLHRIIENLTKK